MVKPIDDPDREDKIRLPRSPVPGRVPRSPIPPPPEEEPQDEGN